MGVALTVAAFLSLSRISDRTMWLDEIYTVGATNELLPTWRETGATQALYYVLVWPVSRISTDPGWMRLPSVLFALLAIGVVYQIGRRLGGVRVGTLAAGGMALSWGVARYSVEARSYTLALLLVSLSWLALITLVEGEDPSARGRWWRVFVTATLLAPLAHGLSVLHFGAQLLALPLAPQGRRWLRRMWVLVVALAVEFGVLAILGAGDVGDWVPPLNLEQVRSIVALLLGFDWVGAVLLMLTTGAGLLVAASYHRDRTAAAWSRLALLFWALGPPVLVVLMSLVRPYAASRYVFSAMPGFFLLIACLLVEHLRSTRWLAAVSLVLALLLLRDHSHVTTVDIEDWQGMTHCMAANAMEGDRLLAIPAHRSPFDYYWPRIAGEGTPEVLSVSSEPLDNVRRLYDLPDEPLDLLLDDSQTHSVWFAERGRWGRAAVAGLAFNNEIHERYVMSDAWFFAGDLTLVRLDPIGSEGASRPEVPCSTVPEPRS